MIPLSLLHAQSSNGDRGQQGNSHDNNYHCSVVRVTLFVSLAGIVVFSLDTDELERLTDFGERPVWLNDSRHLIFLHEDKVFLVDSLTMEVNEVLSVAPHRLQSIGISSDNKEVYFSLSTTESDIWFASLQ